jgi:hypothetical protein
MHDRRHSAQQHTVYCVVVRSIQGDVLIRTVPITLHLLPVDHINGMEATNERLSALSLSTMPWIDATTNPVVADYHIKYIKQQRVSSSRRFIEFIVRL